MKIDHVPVVEFASLERFPWGRHHLIAAAPPSEQTEVEGGEAKRFVRLLIQRLCGLGGLDFHSLCAIGGLDADDLRTQGKTE